MRATKEQDCARCPDPVLPGQQIVPTPRGWVHQGCASGQDDD